jgi:hypothetical protein
MRVAIEDVLLLGVPGVAPDERREEMKWSELNSKERSILIHDQIMHAGAEYVPDYTIDMNAAMLIVEEMRDRDWWWQTSILNGRAKGVGGFEVVFDGVYSQGQDLSEAICHAACLALKLVED